MMIIFNKQKKEATGLYKREYREGVIGVNQYRGLEKRARKLEIKHSYIVIEIKRISKGLTWRMKGSSS